MMLPMNAMESLKDKNMLWLDLVSGATGLFLFTMLNFLEIKFFLISK